MGSYNARMPEFHPLRPDQVAEAKQLIYSVAHEIFHERETLEESIALYESNWQLRDVEEFQHRYLENGGTFLVISDGGRLVGTGALRRLEPETAAHEVAAQEVPAAGEALAVVGEIKRLWLLPEYWGQGLGYQMMMRLLAAAREMGCTLVRLETSASYQHRAYAFYKRLGFYDIPRFGDDPDDVALELRL